MPLDLKVNFKPSNPGTRKVPIYSPKLRDDGSIEIRQTGERDIWSEIQSHADSVDINNIMYRYAMGDTSVLSKTQGIYGDFMSVPKTYAEVLQSVIDGKSFFESLPADVRSKFGSDFNKFYASIGTEEWYAALSDLLPSEAPSEPSEKVSEKAD